MNAHALLTTLYEQGFTLTPLPGDKLEVVPASKLTPALREELRERKAEVLALLKTEYRLIYAQAAEQVQADCHEIDSHWLIEHHPDLWERMRRLDEELNRLEQQGATEAAYGAKVEELVVCVRNARAAYVQNTLPLPN